MKIVITVISAVSATLLTAIGVLTIQYAREDSGWLALIGVFLNVPGLLFAATLAAIFAPKGVENIQRVQLVIQLVNWLFYFCLTLFLFAKVRRHRAK